MVKYQVLFKNKESAYVRLFNEDIDDKDINNFVYEKLSVKEFESWKTGKKEIKNGRYRK